VAVYTVQRLALPGVGVQVEKLPAGFLTYILDVSDQRRVELY
jgi:hypothetical protein